MPYGPRVHRGVGREFVVGIVWSGILYTSGREVSAGQWSEGVPGLTGIGQRGSQRPRGTSVMRTDVVSVIGWRETRNKYLNAKDQ